MLTSATGSATSASTVSVARLAAPDAASAPTSHTPAPGMYVPCDATAPAKISPGGSMSSTRTFVASSGPRFVTDTVNRTRSPTVATPGTRVLTVLSTWRSADGPFTVTPLMSLSGDRIHLVLRHPLRHVGVGAGVGHRRHDLQRRRASVGQRAERPGARRRLVGACRRRRRHERQAGRQQIDDAHARRVVRPRVDGRHRERHHLANGHASCGPRS